MERTSRSVLAGIKNPDPFRSPGCPYRDKCIIEEERSCWVSKIVYALECGICGARYTGTSGATAHKRGLEHLQAWRRTDDSYAMSRHWSASYPEVDRSSQTRPFKMRILKQGEQSLRQRYIKEAPEMKSASEEENLQVLNSRG